MGDLAEVLLAAPLAAAHRGRLAAAVGPGRLVDGHAPGPRTVAAVLAGDPGPEWAAGPALRWLHVLHAGLDGAALAPLLDAGVTVTTGAGRSADALAEQALYFLLALNGRYRTFLRAQRLRVWGVPGQGERVAWAGRPVLVVGTGHTGRAVAQRGAALGMRVRGHRRRDEPVDGCFEAVTSADRGDRLEDVLGEVDAVVLAASLNDGSRHLIGRRQLAAMRPGSYLVNVARGGLVDEHALVDALRSGHLAGAATDVVEGEPLAVGSRLWWAPNLLLTPHSTPRAADRDERAIDLLVDNVERFRSGRPLRNALGPDDVYTGPPMRRGDDHGRVWRRLARRLL